MMLYDITKDWDENNRQGPYLPDNPPSLPARVPSRYQLLGLPLNSRFGLAACPLTANAAWVKAVSRLGYDLLTYKSVRSIPWGGNTFPHWKYVDVPAGTDLRSYDAALVAADRRLDNQDVSMANSFGVYSSEPSIWQADFNKATDSLLPGQLLILSVMPSHRESRTLAGEIEELARLAADTQAKVVEINFACPNTDSGKGLIYENVDQMVSLLRLAKNILVGRKLLAKIGYYKDAGDLARLLKETQGVLDGVSSMNTYSASIRNNDGKETFPGRSSAGVSGAAIRSMAMQQAEELVRMKKELKLDTLAVIGIGGVTVPAHIDGYLSLGVDAVQCAVGAYQDPLLAYKYLQTLS